MTAVPRPARTEDLVLIGQTGTTVLVRKAIRDRTAASMLTIANPTPVKMEAHASMVLSSLHVTAPICGRETLVRRRPAVPILARILPLALADQTGAFSASVRLVLAVMCVT